MADIRIKDLATTATTSASDDYLALDGSTNGTRKILATNIANNVTDVVFGASGPSAKSSIAARAARQGLVFDGTTSPTISVVPAFGANNFSVSLVFNASSVATVMFIGGSTTGQFALRYSGGQFYSSKLNVSDNAARTVSLVAGKSYSLLYVRSGTTAFYYLDGIQVATAPDAQDYTAAVSVLGGINGTAFNGTMSLLGIYNRALSAAEVVSLYEAGVPAGSDYNTASNTAVNTATATNDGSFPYTSFTGATASAFTAVKASGGAYAKFNPIFALTVGQRINVSGTLTLNNGKTVLPLIAVLTSGLSGITAGVSLTAAGAFSIDLTCTTAGNGFVTVNTSGDADYTLSGVVAKRTGLLLAPDAAQSGGALTWYDTSGNAANITLPATGVSWNVPTSGRGIFADGTAAAPSISFAADTDTGLYSHSANIIGLSTAGARTFLFGTGGNIFGTSTDNLQYVSMPTSGAVTIAAGGTNQSITLTPSGNGLSTCYNNARATQLAVGSSVNGVYSIGRDNIATGYFQLRDNSSNVLFSVTPTTGRFLLGTTTDSGALLQIGTNTTTAAGGMVFGTDTNLFRFLPGILRIAYSQAASTGLSSWNQNVAGYAVNNFTTDSDNFDFGVGGSAAGLSALRRCFYIYDNTASAALLTIAQSTGNTVFAGTIKPQQAGTAPTYVKGAIYFDTTLNKLRVGGATAWETITSV